MIKHYIILSFLLIATAASAQEGVNWNKYFIKGSAAIGKNKFNKADSNTYAKNCAWLEIGGDTTTRGMIIPRVADVNTIAGSVRGLIAYDLSANLIMYYDGAGWSAIGAGGGSIGNAGYGLGKAGSMFYVDTTKIVNIDYLNARDFATEQYVDQAIANSTMTLQKAIRACVYGNDEHAVNHAIYDAYKLGYNIVDLCDDTFVINNTILLDTGMTQAHLKGITVQNGFLKLADQEKTTLTVASETGDDFLVVNNIPSAYWQAGGWVQLYTSDHGNSTTRNRRISHVSNDTIYLVSVMSANFPIGASVRRVFTGVTFGMFGADIVTDIDTAGHLRVVNGDTVIARAVLSGIHFDGNRDNRSGNLGWTANTTIGAVGLNIENCVFYSVPGENIIGSEMDVSGCHAFGLNGSFFHHGNSKASHQRGKYHTNIVNNYTYNTNQQYAKNQHGDAVITYSFSSQNMNIEGNYFRNGALCFNYFETSVDIGYIPPRNNRIVNNTFEFFSGISTPNPPFILGNGAVLQQGGNITIANNIFKNCGTNNDWTSLVTAKADSFTHIYWYGNTLDSTTLQLPKHRIFKTDYNGNLWDENKQGFDLMHGGKTSGSDVTRSARFEPDGDFRIGWFGAANSSQVLFKKTNVAHTGTLALADGVSNKVSIFAVDSVIVGGNQFWRLNLFGFDNNTKGVKEEISDSFVIKNKGGIQLWNMNQNGELVTSKLNTRYNWLNNSDLGATDFNTLTNPGAWPGYIQASGLAANNPGIAEYYHGVTYSGDNGVFLTQWMVPMAVSTANPPPPLYRSRAHGNWGPWTLVLNSGHALVTPQRTVINTNSSVSRRDGVIYCVTTGTNDTLTLTNTVNSTIANSFWWIKKQSAANKVVLRGPSGTTINGNTYYEITDTTCPVIVQCTGTNYSIIDNGCGSFLKFTDTANDKPVATKAWSLGQFYAKADVDGLLGDYVLTGDLGTVAFSNSYNDLDDLPTLFDGAYSSLTGIPSTFTPAAHSHAWGDITSSIPTHLNTIAVLSPSNDDFLVYVSGAWTNRTVAQVKTLLNYTKTDIGLGNVDNTSDATKNSASVTLTNKTISYADNIIQGAPFAYTYAISDETSDITNGTAKITFRAPHTMTVTAVRASLSNTSSSGNPTFDINESGTSILGTKLSIDASEKTSITAASAATITDASIADDAEITIDIDTAGTGAKGAKITIIGTR